ncbi:MAG: aminotransferase class I/II-fold pyridoxal phosphate-dependent enzyme [Candidatus Melainabacteria bacterium]|nr:aminotransferase class I/II-fold pyridoxal phosphate-dependent enzyme [Candidatus Melainabacteria bacterium]
MSSTIKTKIESSILPKASVLASQLYDAPPEGRLDFIRLDFNESTSPLADTYPEGMPPSLVSTYPEYGVLLQKLAEYYDVSTDSIILTNGSDEAISVISNTFVEPNQDVAVVSNPCFVMIRNCLKIAGAKLAEVAVLPNLEFDIDSIEGCLEKNPKIAMFASPDNPTGSVLKTETVEKWCEKFPRTLFVIDEAYSEYAGTTVIPLLKKFENLLILKTFSKAWGMAGFRLGMIIGNPNLNQYINRVKLPYSVNSAAVFSALRLLERETDVAARVKVAVEQRSKLARTLDARGFSVQETSANWCLIGAGMQAAALTKFAREKSVLIRNRSTSDFSRFGVDANSDLDAGRSGIAVPPMWGRIRVSVGNDQEMTAFDDILEQFGKTYGLLFDLDGTLVDTSKSFDETVAYLVEKFSGKPFDLKELHALRLEGGYNDDWVASTELLKRRGKTVALSDVARAGEEYYFSIAIDREELLVSIELLKKLRRRCQLFIVTGRNRREYAKVWGERLDPLFDKVYCMGDIAGLEAKPSPDYLNQAMSDFGITCGAYIGNSVDDMRASVGAGLVAIGVTTGADRDAFIEAGAQAIVSNCSEIGELMMVTKQV